MGHKIHRCIAAYDDDTTAVTVFDKLTVPLSFLTNDYLYSVENSLDGIFSIWNLCIFRAVNKPVQKPMLALLQSHLVICVH